MAAPACCILLCCARMSQVPEHLPKTRASVRFVPRSRRVVAFASPCLDGGAILLDMAAASGALLSQLGLPSPPSCMSVCSAGSALAFGMRDGRVLIVLTTSVEEGPGVVKHLGTVGVQQDTPVSCVCFLQGGRHLLASAGAVLASWELP